MSEITETLKGILADGIRIVNRAAGSVASATSYKLSELDAISRRREAITELGEKAFAMFQAGVEMPEEALPLLTELRALEEGLETLRTERQEQKVADKQRNAEEAAARKEQRAADKAARAAARKAEKEARAAAAAAAEEAAARAQAEAMDMDEDVMDAAETDVTIQPVAEEVVAEVQAPVLETAEAQSEAESEEDMMLM